MLLQELSDCYGSGKEMQEQWSLNRVSAMTTVDFTVEGAHKYMEREEYLFLICGWENG